MSESNNNIPMRITQLEEATEYEDGMVYPVAKTGHGTFRIKTDVPTLNEKKSIFPTTGQEFLMHFLTTGAIDTNIYIESGKTYFIKNATPEDLPVASGAIYVIGHPEQSIPIPNERNIGVTFTSETSGYLRMYHGSQGEGYMNLRVIGRIDEIEEDLQNYFLPQEFEQGSLYNGVLDKNNLECISSKNFYEVKNDTLNLFYDIKWNVRISCFGENKNFIKQEGYSLINNFDNYTFDENIYYYKISLSLTPTGQSNTTPEDLLSNKFYFGYSSVLTVDNKNKIYSLKEIIDNNIILKPTDTLKYEGAKIDVSNNEFVFDRYMNLSNSQFASDASIQGSAIYDKYLFTAVNTMKNIAIHDMANKTYLGKISFTPNNSYHCNTISFSNVKYNENDFFPLLYVSMENSDARKAVVLRITTENDTYVAETIQTINYPTIEQMDIFYPNCVVDPQNNLLYISGYTQDTPVANDNNKIKVFKFLLPSISNATVNLTSNDILDSFSYDSLTCTQGMVIKNNKIYQCYGATWTSDTEIYICVIDLIEKGIVTKLHMNEYNYTNEPESMAIYNNNLYMIDLGGNVYKFTFY